ncbi:hypothetical protein CDIK_0056 [Cucumispora dikerogammari]|nr:hypothetical protein CDIK_0056 [Cucumispora dikerogammari]
MKDIEKKLNTEITQSIKSLKCNQSSSVTKQSHKEINKREIKNLKKTDLKEINEYINRVSSFLSQFPEFSNTQKVADSLTEESLLDIENKWYSKYNYMNNGIKVFNIPKRLYGFLSPEKEDGRWDDQKIDELIRLIKK